MIPDCFNAEPITGYWAPSGYKRGKRCMRWIAHRMSQRCKAWATGDRATPAPALDGWQCAGCRWLPSEALKYVTQNYPTSGM